MRYCIHCGSPLGDGDPFCSRCGASSDDVSTQDGRTDGRSFTPIAGAEPKDKLICELAYSGILFWLPLVVSPKGQDTKYHANQGLWVLIVSCLLCWVVQIMGIVKDFLKGSVLGFIFNSVYYVLFAVFLTSMLYLAAQGVKRALAIHRGNEPESILFFEEKAIIR